MSDHHRVYAPIEDVVTLEDAGRRLLANVTVTAELAGASVDVPIGIVVDGGSRLALNEAQADELIRMLVKAKLDVRGGSDPGDEECVDG